MENWLPYQLIFRFSLEDLVDFSEMFCHGFVFVNLIFINLTFCESKEASSRLRLLSNLL